MLSKIYLPNAFIKGEYINGCKLAFKMKYTSYFKKLSTKYYSGIFKLQLINTTDVHYFKQKLKRLTNIAETVHTHLLHKQYQFIYICIFND
jgi:hypothetical protein